MKEELTPKDIAYIEDIFNWNDILINKLKFYLDFVDDNKVINEFDSLIKMHNQICTKLEDALRGDY